MGNKSKAFEEIETSILKKADDENLLQMAEIMLEGIFINCTNFYKYHFLTKI